MPEPNTFLISNILVNSALVAGTSLNIHAALALHPIVLLMLLLLLIGVCGVRGLGGYLLIRGKPAATKSGCFLLYAEMNINWATHGDNSLTVHDHRGAASLDVMSGSLRVSE
jgi:uncharacterized membrane-anchored protein YitT (DUF2179 family)